MRHFNALAHFCTILQLAASAELAHAEGDALRGQLAAAVEHATNLEVQLMCARTELPMLPQVQSFVASISAEVVV